MSIMEEVFTIEQFNELIDIRNRENNAHRENELWYMLCLSLVDNRDMVEEKAFRLAKEHGLLGALKLQKTKKGEW